MPALKPLKPCAAASTKASGRQPLLLQGCSRALACFHQAPGRQRSSIAACPLPAHSPLLLGHSSLPFARLQTPKTPKTASNFPIPCHQALSSSPFAAPALQPALCLHIPRGSFHQAPGRQRSSIAACPWPAHSPLLLGHSSLPFARLQTPKTLRGSFHQAWPSAFAAPGLLLFPGRQRSSIAACPLTLTDLDKSNCKDRTCWWDNLPTHGTGTGKEYRSSDRGALERGSAAPGR